MAVFNCKMCGASLKVIDKQTTAICEYCGTQQTLPRLDDEKRANLYDRANHFRRNNEFDKAMTIYESILAEDSCDAEAYWSLVLCHYGIEYVEDPTTKRRVPTINRAQYTSVFDDDNYRSAIKYADGAQRAIYEKEATAINEIQKEILAVSQKEEPFDVFICYKESDQNGIRTHDSVLANDLYYQLTVEGFKVFFSRITLEDKLGTAYEPYIFAAINSAKVMVVLGTKPEYFNAVWVKNEWSRYLALVKHSGGKKVLIPAYKDMDPYDLPEQFSHLQAQDMSKLGFMQDLIRGIKKLTATEASKPIKIIQETSSGASDAPLLKRAFMFLEDGAWQSAEEYCEKVLDLNPENAEAYLGKLMCKLGCRTKKELREQSHPFDQNSNYIKVVRYGNEELKAELQGYLDDINNRILLQKYNDAIQSMKQAQTQQEFLASKTIFLAFGDFMDAQEKAALCEKLADEAALKLLESRYLAACQKLSMAWDSNSYAMAAKLFEELGNYKDSAEKAALCSAHKQEKLKEEQAKAEKEREEHRKAENHRSIKRDYETNVSYLNQLEEEMKILKTQRAQQEENLKKQKTAAVLGVVGLLLQIVTFVAMGIVFAFTGDDSTIPVIIIPGVLLFFVSMIIGGIASHKAGTHGFMVLVLSYFTLGFANSIVAIAESSKNRRNIEKELHQTYDRICQQEKFIKSAEDRIIRLKHQMEML